uniref:Uncharacterized protein n=1 Tax=Setaria italica TaxID=4555 RepID=K3ZYM1_SETIT
MYSYYVPTTLLVLASVMLEPKILAMPKSEILGFNSLSSKMLLAFKSRWIIRTRECLCKYSSPCAMPSIMCSRFFQSSNGPRC